MDTDNNADGLRTAPGYAAAAAAVTAKRARDDQLIAAAKALGAVAPPRPGEAPDPCLDSGPVVDASELPLGVEPVGAVPRTPRPADLPPLTRIPAGLRNRAVTDALDAAAADLGMSVSGIDTFGSPKQSPDGKLAWYEVYFAYNQQTYTPPEDTGGYPQPVYVDLSATPDRTRLLEAIYAAVVDAGEHWYRPGTPLGIPVEMRGEWPQIRARGPALEGLRDRLHAAAGDDDSGTLIEWFQRISGRVMLAAYEAGVPVSLWGFETLSTGFQIQVYPRVPGASDDEHSCPGLRVWPWMHDEVMFVENTIKAILHSQGIPPGSPDYLSKGRYLYAAAAAAVTPVPDTPPDR